MKFFSLIVGTVAAQTYSCEQSNDCKTDEIVASLNEQY